MPFIDADFVIAGAGLAGLSFAIRLLPILKKENKSLIILDYRKSFEQDKHWCGWGLINHPFKHLVKKSWPNILAGRGDSKTIKTLSSTQYQMISSLDFYSYCIEQLSSEPFVKVMLDTPILHIEKDRIQIKDKTIKATWVLDARQPKREQVKIESSKSALLQCFYGWHVKVEKPLFDLQTAFLMDFDLDQSLGIVFNYLLPLNAYEAVIEPTYFLHHSQIPDKDHFFELAKTYLDEKWGISEFDIIKSEHGVLPMMPMSHKHEVEGVIPIGTSYGLLRPSTGYAFDGIQRHQDKLINYYNRKGQFPSIAPYRSHTIWMDKVFLKVLKQNPQMGAKVFDSLFKNTHIDRIARFMSDEGSLIDCLSVILGVPKVPFIKALFT